MIFQIKEERNHLKRELEDLKIENVTQLEKETDIQREIHLEEQNVHKISKEIERVAI